METVPKDSGDGKRISEASVDGLATRTVMREKERESLTRGAYLGRTEIRPSVPCYRGLVSRDAILRIRVISKQT